MGVHTIARARKTPYVVISISAMMNDRHWYFSGPARLPDGCDNGRAVEWCVVAACAAVAAGLVIAWIV